MVLELILVLQKMQMAPDMYEEPSRTENVRVFSAIPVKEDARSS